LKLGRDIRAEGSGKTGGYNTFVVTRSRWTAVGVGLFDAFKGFAVAFAAWQFFPESPHVQGASIIGALLGHNYPAWLRFKGGRGLATVAGALSALGQFLLIFWCLAWTVSFVMMKSIGKSNLAATVTSLIAVWILPNYVLGWFMIRDVGLSYFVNLLSAILVLLLVSHSDEVRDLFPSRAEKGNQES